MIDGTHNEYPAFAPHRLCVIALILAAVLAGVCIPLAADVKLQMVAILAIAAIGLGVYAVFPNRRIALVCGWVLAHPLSLEKVFPIFPADFPGFMPSPLVISGSDLMLGLLLFTMVLEATIGERRAFRWAPALTPLALLAAWASALFFICGPTTSGVIQVMHWIKLLVFAVTISSAIRNRSELLTVLAAIAVAVLIQSAILGAAYATKRSIGFSSKVAGESMMVFSGGGGESIARASGTVGHVNQQAMFHVFFTVPLAALFMARNYLWRIFAAVVLAASSCAVLLTFSRASWISCGVGAVIIVIVAWKHDRISRTGWLGIAGGAMVVLVALSAFAPLMIKRITSGDDGASASRVRVAMLALENAGTNLITGVGPGNFINAKLSRDPIMWDRAVWLPKGVSYKPRFLAGLELYELKLDGRQYYLPPAAVHNKWLLVLAELGLVGLVLFLWFQWEILRCAWASLRARDAMLWWTAVGLFAVYWTIHIEFMFELFHDDKTVLMPLLMNALMIALARLVAEERASKEAP